MTAILVGLTLLGMLGANVLPPTQSERPVVHQSSTPKVENPTVTGRASWYDYIPGHAAAGPALRAAFGGGEKWRHQEVQVCTDTKCVSVVLSDSCQCYRGEKRERVIDLDDSVFAALAPLGRGIIRVEVTTS